MQVVFLCRLHVRIVYVVDVIIVEPSTRIEFNEIEVSSHLYEVNFRNLIHVCCARLAISFLLECVASFTRHSHIFKVVASIFKDYVSYNMTNCSNFLRSNNNFELRSHYFHRNVQYLIWNFMYMVAILWCWCSLFTTVFPVNGAIITRVTSRN